MLMMVLLCDVNLLILVKNSDPSLFFPPKWVHHTFFSVFYVSLPNLIANLV